VSADASGSFGFLCALGGKAERVGIAGEGVASDSLIAVAQSIGQRPLQRLGFIPWGSHPDVVLFLRRQNHGHGLGVYRFNDRVRRRRQEAIDEMRARDRLGLRTTVASELGPDPCETPRWFATPAASAS
jgi:hypothetical protein